MIHSLLFDARLVLPRPTGIGQYIASLLPPLLRLVPDWQIHLLRRPDPWPGYGIEGWAAPGLTHHVSRLPHLSLRQHLVVPWLARRLGAELLHYPHFDAPVLWQPAPVIATLHDLKYLVRPDFFPDLGGPKRAYMRWAIARTVQRAAAVIAVSEHTAADLRRLFDVRAPLHVVYEAADPSMRPAPLAAVAAARAQYGLVRPYVLAVGERRPHKNHAALVRAYAQSRSQVSHDLVIVGQPYSDYRAPEATVEDLGLAGRVHLLHGVSHRELVALYTGASLFVLVSLYEGFGLPLLEAMACGTPVVASATTATGEIVGDGGLTVDPTDEAAIAAAIDRVLHDEALHAVLATRGHARAAAFSWERAARETLAVYEQALARQ